MSRGRGLLVSIFQNIFSSIRPRSVKGKLRGTDHLGNTYYEVIPQSFSNKTRPSRYYIPKNEDTSKFDEPLPVEWEAWLRLRRNEPPTKEEIQNNLELMNTKKANALELDNKYCESRTTKTVTGIKEFPDIPEYEKIPGKGPS